ncbi:MAG: 50S ribosomal protein L17 [Chloroflexi bacterium RBG_16_57_9]|nr:MAG: 50S ribosomal protein L17 [Chloroflexi bacterium RBG_16_57_9]
MRHRVSGRHLGRNTAHRRSLFRNLITQLFMYERIKTTEAKAKAIRAEAEKLITTAKRSQPERIVALANEGATERLATLVKARNAEELTSLAQAGETAKLETRAKQIALHARRQVLRTVSDKTVVDKLIHEIAPEYEERPGGYTRLIKLGMRQGDAAPMVLLELVD